MLIPTVPGALLLLSSFSTHLSCSIKWQLQHLPLCLSSTSAMNRRRKNAERSFFLRTRSAICFYQIHLHSTVQHIETCPYQEVREARNVVFSWVTLFLGKTICEEVENRYCECPVISSKENYCDESMYMYPSSLTQNSFIPSPIYNPKDRCYSIQFKVWE